MFIFSSISDWWYGSDVKPAGGRNIPVHNINVKDIKPEMIVITQNDILKRKNSLKHVNIDENPKNFGPFNSLIGDLQNFFKSNNVDGVTNTKITTETFCYKNKLKVKINEDLNNN
jgi:hypothetical protein